MFPHCTILFHLSNVISLHKARVKQAKSISTSNVISTESERSEREWRDLLQLTLLSPFVSLYIVSLSKLTVVYTVEMSRLSST